VDSVKLLLTLLGFFVPPNPIVTDWVTHTDPDLLKRAEKSMKELQMWYWKMSGAVFLLVVGLTWVVFFAPFARAQSVDALSKSQSELSIAINEQLAVATADNICRMVLRRSKEGDGAERWRLRQDIDALQQRYRTYTKRNEDYPEQRCAGN
jgi:hypothetical protein